MQINNGFSYFAHRCMLWLLCWSADCWPMPLMSILVCILGSVLVYWIIFSWTELFLCGQSAPLYFVWLINPSSPYFVWLINICFSGAMLFFLLKHGSESLNLAITWELFFLWWWLLLVSSAYTFNIFMIIPFNSMFFQWSSVAYLRNKLDSHVL